MSRIYNDTADACELQVAAGLDGGTDTASGGCILGGAVGLVTTPTQSKMARSLMRGIQLKLVFVVVTYTVMCYIQLVAGQGSSLSYLDPSITLDTALFTMDFETSSVDLLEPSSTSSAPTT